MTKNTRFARCHLCGQKTGGHLPLCSRCYKKYLVGGKPPEWLRFLLNDLNRENRGDSREADWTISLYILKGHD